MIRFTVQGQVIGKGRPRATARGGFARVYTPARTVEYEKRVKEAAIRAMAGRAPVTCAVEASVRVRVAPPASASKRRQAELLASDPITSTDVDNAAKAILDACNKIVFADDRQVVKLLVERVWAALPGADVLVVPRSAGGAP